MGISRERVRQLLTQGSRLGLFEYTPSNDPYVSMMERLKKVHDLYKKCGTLEAAGKEMGVSRERVRQLLTKGSRLGFFEYRPFDYPYLSKEKLIADYSRYPSMSRVAHVNGIGASYLRRLITAYGITEEDLRTSRHKRSRSTCQEEYQCVVNVLGHHPSTTELQADSSFGVLYRRIKKLWGSFDAFRDELNVPKPPSGSPSFNEDMQPWREHKKRLALILRMQHLDRICECLRQSGPLSSSQIAYECGIKQARVLRLLPLLLMTREVAREGEGTATKYEFIAR
jgi:hypothetical protein